MKYSKLLLFIIFTLVFSVSGLAQRKFGGTVVDVVDGKTVVVELQAGSRITFELQYIEVPEPEQQLHQTVRQHLQQMVGGKAVECVARGVAENRTLGQLFVGGVDVSQQLLRDGAAWHVAPEKSGQAAAESEVYQNNEAQAKTEKRGVWSIENLLPAWEFRARKDEIKFRQEKAELEKTGSQTQTVSTSKSRRWTVDEQLKANANQELWANVYRSSSVSANGLATTYDKEKRIGATIVPFALALAAGGSRQTIGCGLMYAYRGEPTNIEYSRYGVYCISAPQIKFLSKFKSVTVVVDKQRFTFNNPFRPEMTTVSGEEMIVFKTDKIFLTKVANAKKAEFKLGQYTGVIGEDVQALLKKLLSRIN
jgi:endonuclease YncB( thermonuclease family)